MIKQKYYAEKILHIMVEQGLVLEEQKEEYLEYLQDEVYDEEF